MYKDFITVRIKSRLFYDKPSGFAIFMSETLDKSKEVTLKGYFDWIKYGTPLKFVGEWKKHKKYGEYFFVEDFHHSADISIDEALQKFDDFIAVDQDVDRDEPLKFIDFSAIDKKEDIDMVEENKDSMEEESKDCVYKEALYHKKIKTIEQQVNEEQIQENRDRYLELSQELLRGFKVIAKHSLD